MIVSYEHNFCFIHIPKCGGSSIRDQIGDLDSLGGTFHGKTLEVPGGPQQKAHLPLHTIREYFPDIFESIIGLEKIVIVRDPQARFMSAMSQRAREIHGKFLDEMTAEQISTDFKTIARHLEENPSLPSYPFRHFCRQSDFANLDGRLFVEHVVPLDSLPQLFMFLSKKTGRHMDSGFHSNKTVVIRNKTLKPSLLIMKDWAKGVLPLAVYTRVKDFGLKLFANQGVAPHVMEVVEKEDFQAFITSFYADDYALLALGRSRNTMQF